MTAINEGIAGFFGVIDAIIVVIISIIPLLIITGVAYAGYRFWKGRRPGTSLGWMQEQEHHPSHDPSPFSLPAAQDLQGPANGRGDIGIYNEK